MKHWYVLIIFFLILSGCTVVHYEAVTNDYQYELNSEEGIVLVSITELDYQSLWGRRWFPHLEISKLGDDRIGYISSFVYGANHALGRTEHKNDTDYPDKSGTLLAIRVPAGEYQVSGAGIFINGMATWEVTNWKPINFKVSAGSVTYLGNYEFYIGKYQAPDYIVIKSEEIEDVSMFKKRFDHLKNMPIKNQAASTKIDLAE